LHFSPPKPADGTGPIFGPLLRQALNLPSAAALLFACTAACGPSLKNIRPPPPSQNGGTPIADPPPSRVVIHATIFRDAIRRRLEESLPLQGEGEAPVLAGRKLHYSWKREPFQLRFDRGRILVAVNAIGTANFLGARDFPVRVAIAGEPIVTADYKALLQSTEVKVTSTGPVERINRGLEEKLNELLTKMLDEFKLDVRPLLSGVFARIARPVEIPLGNGLTACATLRIAALEAGPTVLADGVEKDLGIVVLPSVTLPCAPAAAPAIAAGDGNITPAQPAPAASDSGLPLLANVAAIPSGPFRVTIPVAARYEELGRAIETWIHGRLFFSKAYPQLFIEKPRVFPSDDQVVLQVSIGGSATLAGIDTNLSGDLFFAGHPRVIDNQITIPDLQITAGTADQLVKLKISFDQDAIRDQAQAALRVDVGERLQAIKDKLSTELTFSDDSGCVRAEALRTEVTGIFAHQSFLRVLVQVDAQAALYLPCRR